MVDLKIKHFSSVRGCGGEQICGAWNSIELNKNQLLPH